MLLTTAISFKIISLTISSSEVLVDPGESKLGSDHSSEADINIIGVESRLIRVFVTTNFKINISRNFSIGYNSYTVHPRHFQWVTSNGLRKRGYTLESRPISISRHDARPTTANNKTTLFIIFSVFVSVITNQTSSLSPTEYYVCNMYSRNHQTTCSRVSSAP